MINKSTLLAILAMAGAGVTAEAANVQVTMNTVSTTMSLTDVATGAAVDAGAPAARVYNFEAPAGEYLLTAYGTNGTTVNGTIVLNVADTDALQEFKVITNTAYVSNKNSDGSQWTIENGDYTLDLTVNTREGVRQTVTAGKSVTAGRYTFLALNGNSYNLAFVPSKEHQEEGYTTLYKAGTLTANVNVTGAIPKGENYTITAPADAELFLGLKFVHFTDFTAVEPIEVTEEGGYKKYTYYLAQGQVYNYRTWRKDGITQAGYFTMTADASKRPAIAFTDKDYTAYDPHGINHDVTSNLGYETGDIFVNINERGHLALNVGDTFKAHAMRTWELTDNSTNNYFMEPDFHYTVLTADGKPSQGVIEIDHATGSSWADIKAVGQGTAIVLVTYDAICCNYYSASSPAKMPILGGEYWGAIWPENTAAYVVTVGEASDAVTPNMLINAKYNTGALKNSGDKVDAEHDVFYYLDTEEGALYTFAPEGVAEVTLAYPVVGDRMATYTGFGAEGVTRNEDGSYTLLLKEGRNIVRLADASGKSVYQVLTAKSCHREIVNASRPGSAIYQPGDKITVQYSGLRHPANKLAGIYNMSAYVTYNAIPNGSSLILSANQYTFGSAASAQAVTFNVPADHDVAAEPFVVMDEGVIQVNGYGDPIGNHRVIDPVAGRSPNFTAVAHKTYFGAIPEVRIPLSAVKLFNIRLTGNVDDADLQLVGADGVALIPGEDGVYSGTFGNYTLTAKKSGYRCFHGTYNIPDDAEGDRTFAYELTEAPAGAWDGVTLTEPAQNDNGSYVITNGAELAWFGDKVNGSTAVMNAVVTEDIDLADYDWTPIGNTTSRYFRGTFTGNGHRIDGLHIDTPATDYRGLFGYVRGTAASPASVTGVTVSGDVSGRNYVGGVAGYVYSYAVVDTCANYASVLGASSNVGGVGGYVYNNANARVLNCYNAGSVESNTVTRGGVVGGHGVLSVIGNVFNVGEIRGNGDAGACVGSTQAKTGVSNCFATTDYGISDGHTLVSDEQMRSGEIAYLLGAAFGQKIGTDAHPTFGAPAVLYDAANNLYYNDIPDGVEDVAVDAASVEAYYNLQGIASSKPFKGVNIVRYTNGTCVKTYVR